MRKNEVVILRRVEGTMCGVKLVEKRRSQVLKGFAGFEKERQTKQIM